MLSSSAFNELVNYQQELQTKLEANPTYKELQAVSLLIESHTKFPNTYIAIVDADERPGLLTTKTQRDQLVASAKELFTRTANAPMTIKQVVANLRVAEIEIPGSSPGTTLGAIISKNKDFEYDKENGLWKLADEAYTQAIADSLNDLVGELA